MHCIDTLSSTDSSHAPVAGMRDILIAGRCTIPVQCKMLSSQSISLSRHLAKLSELFFKYRMYLSTWWSVLTADRMRLMNDRNNITAHTTAWHARWVVSHRRSASSRVRDQYLIGLKVRSFCSCYLEPYCLSQASVSIMIVLSRFERAKTDGVVNLSFNCSIASDSYFRIVYLKRTWLALLQLLLWRR